MLDVIIAPSINITSDVEGVGYFTCTSSPAKSELG
jgi:hypothetical protein